MKAGARISVIIPTLNEEAAIGRVIAAIPAFVDDVVVADNGSTDGTRDVAAGLGARVVREPRRGYGAACLAGLAALADPDIVVFLDGDYSDYPEEMGSLVDPILRGEADLVIGSRVLGEREAGALTPQARFGNWLACVLIWLIWRVKYTDLGPFRAVRYTSFRALGMQDKDYGWTVEMQIKAAARGLKVQEVPVRYRKRLGRSKISGTIRGIVGAGVKILATIGQEGLSHWGVA
jgi:glycosyltransferase involved in cell wall biosynthesis